MTELSAVTKARLKEKAKAVKTEIEKAIPEHEGILSTELATAMQKAIQTIIATKITRAYSECTSSEQKAFRKELLRLLHPDKTKTNKAFSPIKGKSVDGSITDYQICNFPQIVIDELQTKVESANPLDPWGLEEQFLSLIKSMWEFSTNFIMQYNRYSESYRKCIQFFYEVIDILIGFYLFEILMVISPLLTFVVLFAMIIGLPAFGIRLLSQELFSGENGYEDAANRFNIGAYIFSRDALFSYLEFICYALTQPVKTGDEWLRVAQAVVAPLLLLSAVVEWTALHTLAIPIIALRCTIKLMFALVINLPLYAEDAATYMSDYFSEASTPPASAKPSVSGSGFFGRTEPEPAAAEPTKKEQASSASCYGGID